MRRTAWFLKAHDVSLMMLALLSASILLIVAAKALPVIIAAKMALLNGLK